MLPFSAVQKERIFQAFAAMDPLASRAYNYTETGFTYQGYVSLDGLLYVAGLIATIQREIAEDQHPQPSPSSPDPFSP